MLCQFIITDLITVVEQKKAELDRLRPLSPGALANREPSYDFELTDTWNAIEVNALTRIETSLVIEHGITSAASRSKTIWKPSIITMLSFTSLTWRNRQVL